jgi:hypothetical protein
MIKQATDAICTLMLAKAELRHLEYSVSTEKHLKIPFPGYLVAQALVI